MMHVRAIVSEVVAELKRLGRPSFADDKMDRVYCVAADVRATVAVSIDGGGRLTMQPVVQGEKLDPYHLQTDIPVMAQAVVDAIERRRNRRRATLDLLADELRKFGGEVRVLPESYSVEYGKRGAVVAILVQQGANKRGLTWPDLLEAVIQFPDLKRRYVREVKKPLNVGKIAKTVYEADCLARERVRTRRKVRAPEVSPELQAMASTVEGAEVSTVYGSDLTKLSFVGPRESVKAALEFIRGLEPPPEKPSEPPFWEANPPKRKRGWKEAGKYWTKPSKVGLRYMCRTCGKEALGLGYRNHRVGCPESK